MICIYFRNTKMPCESSLLPQLDLSEWNQVASVIILSTETLKNVVAQAEDDMREIINLENQKPTNTDLKSPIGTAFRFNRPKREATMIANTSLLLQLASMRLMDNYAER